MVTELAGQMILAERIIVLGSPGAGKTSLINALRGTPSEDPVTVTRGLDINQLEFSINDSKVVASVWDFGGQTNNMPFYSIFASNQSIHLLVLDGSRNSDIDADFWLEQISVSANGAPCIVVLNKADLSVTDLNRRDLLSKFPFIVGFLTMSLSLGKGIEDLRIMLVDLIRTQSNRVRFPLNFQRISEIFLTEPASYRHLEDFALDCQKMGIATDLPIESAVGLFHDYGLIYLYKPKISNEPAVIINVNWLIAGIDLLLNGDRLALFEGIFYKTDVLAYFLKNNYTGDEAKLLLSVMDDTGISFETSKRELILPDLLPKQIPHDAFEVLNKANVNVYYIYRYLPRHLFNIMLAVLQKQGLEHIWTDGILINNPLGTAVVKLDFLRRRIDLYVKGQEISNKRLLQKIRKIIADVNELFRDIEYDEWVTLPENKDVALQYDELLLLNERKTTFITKFINKKPVDINIKELLRNIIVEDENKRTKIFISYSHKDLSFKHELLTHLSPLTHANAIDVYEDTLMAPGTSWEKEINWQLENADIIFVLLSPDLIASEYFFNTELPKMMRLYDTGRVRIIPILIRDTFWQSLPINKIQMLPFDGQPIANFNNRDSVWRLIVAEVGKLVDEITGKLKEIDTLKVSKVSLRNIRCFDEMEVELLNDNGLQMFSLFLGENGVGKSTILKSIPLGVANESETIAMLSKMSGEILKVGTEEGKITVTLFSDKEDREYVIETFISKGVTGQLIVSKSFPPDLDLKQLFICGYGASRNRFGTDNLENYAIHNSCSSLFNYDAALQNPELSFRRIQGRGISIDTLLRRVDQLLMLEPGSTTMDNTGLRLKGPWGEFVPIGGLGDGYKAMLGWISDLLAWSLIFDERMFQTSISGIVIIDELEQHLHPRWQLIVIKLLKDIFPKLQFIGSSHTPLLASGAADYPDTGLYTIERLPEHKINVRSIPRELIEGENFNKVLLEAFGMLSSLSPKAIQNIERFAYLSSQPTLNTIDTIELQNIGDHLISKDINPASEIDDITLKNRLSNFL